MAEYALAPALSGIHRSVAGPLLLLCALALVAPSVGAALGVPLAGWEANHGHVGPTALTPHHVHPYEHASSSSAQTDDDGGFSFSNEGAAGAAIAPVDDPITLPAAPSPFPATLAHDDTAAASAVVSVPTPPPRTPPV